MKISIIGGGAWGTTLGQVLVDNKHQVFIYEPNLSHLNKINNGVHPVFDLNITSKIKASNNLLDVINFSNTLLLVLPSKYIKETIEKIVVLKPSKLNIINASKGICPDTLLMINQIIKESIPSSILENYATITGPSHAEEVILRKLTMLTVASNNEAFATKVQYLFSNQKYLRVYRSYDLIGAEVGGCVKNALAVMSGFATGLGLGENARAALITRGLNEIKRITLAYGGKIETVYGLTGLGDLVVTCFSENSRNYQAGKKLAEGYSIEEIEKHSKQTIEGFRSIKALYKYGKKNNLYLPLIEISWQLINNEFSKDEVIKLLLEKNLKEE